MSGSSSKRLLLAAAKMFSGGHAKQHAVSLEVLDPVCGSLRVLPTLECSIDDVGRHAKPWMPSRSLVLLRRLPLPRHHIVARRLRQLRCHPEPYRRLERDHRILRHQIGVVEEILAYSFPSLAVVVVAAVTTPERRISAVADTEIVFEIRRDSLL